MSEDDQRHPGVDHPDPIVLKHAELADQYANRSDEPAARQGA